MTTAQISILCILIASIAMFLWGKWRHDMVALAALIASVMLGLVEQDDAFSGFGHPAVITVACILILSSGLQQTGAIDIFARKLLPQSAGPLTSIAALTATGAVLSAFMNNVGALALLMPAALLVANRLQIAPGTVLMPLSFGSILGGMTTLIGTPPNLIVSSFRAETGRGTFGMFDFTPVGAGVAVAGVVFIVVCSRWLVPKRRGPIGKAFATEAYITEARVPESGRAVGMTVAKVESRLEKSNATFVGLVRDERRIPAFASRHVQAGDILIIQAEPENLPSALTALDLQLEEDLKIDHLGSSEEGEESEFTLIEAAVLPNSRLAGRSATDIRLRSRYAVDLLGVSRQGQRSISRLRSMPLASGDVLLLQGRDEQLSAFANDYGCLPLADRAVRIPDKAKAYAALGIMVAAVAGAAFGLAPAALSFAAGALAVMATRVVSPRNVYQAVDWPVIVLLGALLPVAGAISTTGLADLAAKTVIEPISSGNPVLAIVLVLVVTMTLSDFMNNAATAAVMCPIAISVADQMGARPDSFLMAVAIGASCAFLTPIGHQNNTLILGPGGFRFADYWRLGLPLEALVVVTAVPLLLLVWPL